MLRHWNSFFIIVQLRHNQTYCGIPPQRVQAEQGGKQEEDEAKEEATTATHLANGWEIREISGIVILRCRISRKKYMSSNLHF